MRVTVRNEPSESGLARVCQSPRGYIIKLDGEDVARVGSSRDIFAKTPEERGRARWHWYGSVAGTRKNSAADGEEFETKEAARDACVAWLKATAKDRSTSPTKETGR